MCPGVSTLTRRHDQIVLKVRNNCCTSYYCYRGGYVFGSLRLYPIQLKQLWTDFAEILRRDWSPWSKK